MGIFDIFKSKKKKEIEQLEKDFHDGKVLLPSDLRDYENLEEFKEKCPDSILEKLNEIERKERGQQIRRRAEKRARDNLEE